LPEKEPTMTLFRSILVLMVLALYGYTGLVVWGHGWSLFPVFFGQITRIDWAGQFNLDFLFLLALSGVWVSWRHRFSGAGLALGALASVGGVMFFAVYLLVETFRWKGDPRALLLGENRGG